MSLPAILLVTAVVCLVLAPVLFFGRHLVRIPRHPYFACRDAPRTDEEYQQYDAWRRIAGRRARVQRLMGLTGLVLLPLAAITGIVLLAGGAIFAGEGSAPDFAREWVETWRPGAAVECQARDTNNDGYVSCTVGTPGGEIVAIECGLDRWYHGWGVTGCRLVRTGDQP